MVATLLSFSAVGLALAVGGVGCGGQTKDPASGKSGGPASTVTGAATGAATAGAQGSLPRATCADRKQCPADKPICVVGTGGPVCAAEGSPEYRAAPASARWVCTLQSDCPPDRGCFAPWDEESPSRSACGTSDVLQSAPSSAFCDASERCEANDPDCTPCKSADVAGLPWIGNPQ